MRAAGEVREGAIPCLPLHLLRGELIFLWEVAAGVQEAARLSAATGAQNRCLLLPRHGLCVAGGCKELVWCALLSTSLRALIHMCALWKIKNK